MSVRVMTWVWEHSRTIGNDRLVLLSIADRASDEGMDAWPSIATLAKKTRLHERTVQRCIRSIEALGELEIKRNEGRQGTNVYIVRMDCLALADSRPRRRVPTARRAWPAEGVTPGNTPPPGNLPPGGTSAGGGVAPPPPGGGSTATGGVAPPPPDTSPTSGTTSTSIVRTAPHAAPPTQDGFSIRPETRLRLAKEPNADNYRVIAALAAELLQRGSWDHNSIRYEIGSEQDLRDALKDECARMQIDRGRHPDVAHDVIHRAAASEWFKHTHPDIAGARRVSK
jgi:hypothetical protein